MEKMKWWTTPRRVIQPILTVGDGKCDVRAMVEELAEMGCDTILHNVGGMVAWYPTQVECHQTPPGMVGDPLGQVIETARSKGMRVMGRFDFSGLTEQAYQAHPSWFYRDENGKSMIDKGYYATCMSGAFMDEYVLPIIREVVQKYQLDGAFLNMFGYRTTDRRGVYHGPCQCSSCQTRYPALMGQPLPKALGNEEINESYRSFCDKGFMETLRWIDQQFKAVNPDFTMLIGYGTQSPYFLLEGIGETTEVELHWTPPNPKQINNGQYVNWRYVTGASCRQLRTMDSGFGSMINLYTCGGGRFTAHSAGFVESGLAQILANGGGPFIAFTGEPWALDRKHRPAIRTFYRFMADHEDYFSNLQSVARIALLNAGKELRTAASSENFAKEFRGVYNTLLRAHHEFDVVDVMQLERPDGENLLDRYRLVVLPNIHMLTQTVIDSLQKFVQQGGHLLVTGECSLQQGAAKENSLAMLLGITNVDMVHPYVENAFLRNDGSLPSLCDTDVVVMNGRYVYTKRQKNCNAMVPMTGELEFASPELEVLMPENGQHGFITVPQGKGVAAHIPWEIGKLIYTYGLQDHILFLEDAVKLALDEPAVIATDAPGQVEVTLYRQPNGRMILQLVNQSGQDGIEVRSPITITDLNLTVCCKNLEKVTTRFGEEQQLSATRQGDMLTFKLPKLELYQLITLE